MHIRPPRRLDRVQPPVSRRRMVLRRMLVGSVLFHLVLVAVLLLFPPTPPGLPESGVPDDTVAVMFENAPGPTDRQSVQDDAPSQQAAVALGNPASPRNAPDADPASSAPPTASSPPPPDQPVVEASIPAPPEPAPPQPAPPEPPLPETPPPAPQASTPPPPTPVTPPRPPLPPTVTLVPPSTEALPPPPPFVPPFAPPQLTQILPPVPPRPRPPSPPRMATWPPTEQRSPSGFPMPQNWALNGTPSRPSLLGSDVGTAPRGGAQTADMHHLSGAEPGADWGKMLHDWAAAHAFYPPQAAVNGEDGQAVVQLTIARSGKVLSVDLVQNSGSRSLDSAWLSVWRGATVPRFPVGTPGDTTTIEYTINYILIRR